MDTNYHKKTTLPQITRTKIDKTPAVVVHRAFSAQEDAVVAVELAQNCAPFLRPMTTTPMRMRAILGTVAVRRVGLPARI